MNEIGILKAILNKKTFIKYSKILFKLDNLQKEIKLIVTTLKDYFVQFPDVGALSIDELAIFFDSLYPKYKDRELIDGIFDKVKSAEIYNEKLLKLALDNVAKSHCVAEIVTEGIKYLDEGKSDDVLDSIITKISDYHNLVDGIEKLKSGFITESIEELLEQTKPTGIRWRLPILNDTIGSIQSGSLGHIFGPSHSGKTTLAISEATYLIRQLKDTDQKVLYFGNEEGMRRVMVRIYCSFFGQEPSWVEERKHLLTEIYNKNGGLNLLCITETAEVLAEIELKISEYKPKIVFIDQGTKVRIGGQSALKSYERLQQVYETYRRLAVKYDLAIITTGQADGDSKKIKYLTLGNLDQSKVGVPGELDFAIGLSHLDQPDNPTRYLSICKNKLTGVLDKGVVSLNNKTCRVT